MSFVTINPSSADVVHARHDVDVACSGCSASYRQNHQNDLCLGSAKCQKSRWKVRISVDIKTDFSEREAWRVKSSWEDQRSEKRSLI